MGQFVLDITTVGADQLRQLHVGVMDMQIDPLADQLLRQGHQRAFTQIVSATFKTQADHGDPAFAAAQDELQRVVDLMLIAGDHAGQHRHVHVLLLGDIQQGTQILGQAGAAEGETGAQVSGRDVELPVPGDQTHDLARVDPQGLPQAADLVGEDNLDRVEGITGVLEHLRRADVGADKFARQVLEHRPDDVQGARRVAADHGERRIVIILDRAALAQELRLKGQAEAFAQLFAGVLFQYRPDPIHDRAGAHGRANHHHVILIVAGQGLADLRGDFLNGPQILAAVRLGRGSHTDKGQRALADRLVDIVGHRQPALFHHVAGQLLDTFFHDGRVAAAQQIQFGRIHVHADDLVTVAGQAGGGNGAHIPHAENCDIHSLSFLIIVLLFAPSGTVGRADYL